MASKPFHKEVLDNGIRVIAEEIPSVKSVSVGIGVDVGSRDETDAEAGLSHFIEHMLFKGTTRRSAHKIAQEIDSLGGELNAFTSQETTLFYARVTDEHIPEAVRLLSDLFRHSTFRPVEIEREKRVILEEIKMVEDDPEDLVHDLHTAHVWHGNPLSRSILGDVKTIRSISRLKILDYLNRKYLPERIVISVAGRFNRRRLLPQIARAFRGFGRSPRRHGLLETHSLPVINSHRVFIRTKRLQQAHLCLGLPGLPLTHRDRYGAHALNTLLGGGVSSRLFQEVREKRGLVYSIYSHLAGFKDAGMLTVYAASSPKAIRLVVQLTVEELRRLKDRGVRSGELERAVNQMKGSILLGLESTNSRMSRLVRDEIYFGRFFSLEEILNEIGKVSKRQIRRLSEELLDPRNLSLTVLGPVDSDAAWFENLLDA